MSLVELSIANDESYSLTKLFPSRVRWLSSGSPLNALWPISRIRFSFRLIDRIFLETARDPNASSGTRLRPLLESVIDFSALNRLSWSNRSRSDLPWPSDGEPSITIFCVTPLITSVGVSLSSENLPGLLLSRRWARSICRNFRLFTILMVLKCTFSISLKSKVPMPVFVRLKL